MALELYLGEKSICSSMSRLALCEKNLGFTKHPIELWKGEHITPEYLQLNPKLQVPVLIHHAQDGKKILSDSREINYYLEKTFPSPSLMPSNTEKQSEVNKWLDRIYDISYYLITFGAVDENEKKNKQAMRENWGGISQHCESAAQKYPDLKDQFEKKQSAFNVLYSNTGNSDLVKEEWKKIEKLLQDMEATLSGQKFLVGDTFTFADLHAIPFLYRVVSLGRGGMIESEQAVKGYFEGLKARSSVQKVYDLCGRPNHSKECRCK